MLLSLLMAKQFCQDLAPTEKALHLSPNEWQKISDLLSALEPLKITTVVFQREDLLPGDFYAAWIKCYLTLKKLNSTIAKSLLAAMKKREDKLLENEAFLAALYLSPKYMSIVCAEPEKELKARNCLKNLWTKLSIIEAESKSTTNASATSSQESTGQSSREV